MGTDAVFDTLYLYASSSPSGKYWGEDQLIYCRLALSANIYDLYDLIPHSKPGITVGNSYWYDRNLGKVPPFTFGPNNYATLSGKSSIGIPDNITGDAHYSTYAPTNMVNIADLKSNIQYHYLWQLDPGIFPCFINLAGEPDSGTMVLIVQDPAIARDYTAQLCKHSYLIANDFFDLNSYSGLNVTWQPKGAPTLNDNYKFSVSSISPGTYKYSYTIPPGCGPGGTGVFYIKVTNNINIPQTKTVKYCVEKLPATININDILGVGVNGLTWTPTNLDGFDSNTGILDIAAYAIAHGDIKAGDHIDFTVNLSSQLCDVSNTTKVIIKFVDVL
jgi:hypothetical protein